jgi:hypothetical protein
MRPLIFPASEALPQWFDGIQPPPERGALGRQNWRRAAGEEISPPFDRLRVAPEKNSGQAPGTKDTKMDEATVGGRPKVRAGGTRGTADRQEAGVF